MDKKYDHTKHEKDIYKMWEKGGYFKASKKGTPYTILMPPPNANASLHAGHAMYTIDDIMVRWKRMQGYSALWIPGMDHAGFETQYVYEKHLKKEGKSRMDFDKDTLYKNIYEFVEDNSGLVYKQFKRLGFSADWDRSVFTLDEHVIKKVYQTFEKMHQDEYVYRDDYIVNYCTHCGTSLAELEVKHQERKDNLYYIRYELIDKKASEPSHIVIATVRPETIFVDTHIAVNPKDKKNKWLIGRKVKNPITGKPMDIIGDDYADPEFGTGIVKLTPAHDPNDFEIAKAKDLPIIQAIDWYGKIMESGGKYAGLSVQKARKKTSEDLKAKGLMEKIDKKYEHSVLVCYKCRHDLEPLTVPNWFIKVDDLKAKVKSAVEADKVKFFPKRFKKQMLTWLDIMHDWPISRQVVWGIRIPVWYKVDRESSNIHVWWIDKNKKLHTNSLKHFLDEGYNIADIEKGLQKVYALSGDSAPEYVVSGKKPDDGNEYIPETDTFDTWFSSGQWPLVTLKDKELETRLPTDMIGTLSDILKFWISRMILFSLYLENEVPFKDVYLWSMVADEKGVKMSKSKGNVVNPIKLIDKYGADALRMTLVFGVAPGSKIPLSEDKVRGMRNFANKLWNMARFMNIMFKKEEGEIPFYNNKMQKNLTEKDKKILKKLEKTINKSTKAMKKYRFSDATEAIYHFMWEEVASDYLESIKDRKDKKVALSVFRHVFINGIKLLHPFMPFVTEAIWQNIPKKKDEPLIVSSWPNA